MSNATAGRRAFTLIELLVVIAIISLLVSILLPSLQKARTLSQSVVCASNHRSVGLDVLLYTEEYAAYPHSIAGDSAVYKKTLYAFANGHPTNYYWNRSLDWTKKHYACPSFRSSLAVTILKDQASRQTAL